MDTILALGRPGRRGMRYRHHSLEFKRELVERSFVPGASVAKIAREHDLNANQLFAWRSAYRAGKLGPVPTSTFLPVTISDVPSASVTESAKVLTPSSPALRTANLAVRGRIVLEREGLHLSIEGMPDREVLAQVLSALLR
ncbi:MAG: transposase [Uliginosibacterium sp.]|nr:transposase [Uliginosibacterium sp.]